VRATIRQRLLGVTTGLAVLLLALACAPTAAPAPPARPAAEAQAPAPSAAGAWDQVLAAARREGQVVLMSQGGADIPAALSEGFRQKYPDIALEQITTAAAGGELSAKLLQERAAGQYRVDVVVLGTTTMLTGLVAAGAADPIQPYLVGPNVTDPSKWRTGKIEFADDAETYSVIFLGGVKTPFVYQPGLVNLAELKSYKDLLDPRWRGKVSMIDPRGPGSGLASATFLYKTPGLGKEFLAELFANGLVLTRDDRQQADWVARGQYPIGLATSDFAAVALKNSGVPIEFLPGDHLQEGTYLTASGGSVGVINRAPHPNAAKVYVDWLLSKEGQEAAARAYGYPSLRADASTEGLPSFLIPKAGVPYDQSAKEPYVRLKDEVTEFLKTVIRDQ
jgi:iron(III) transport system substrate-binding protein